MVRKFNIGISCIGSGVGQSVVNSCRLSKLPIRTIGFGTNPMAYGLYDCDDYVYAPSIYSEGYVEKIISLARQAGIDLLVPGMDDEAHIFAKHVQLFNDAGIEVITAGKDLLDLCRDKELMSNELNSTANIFVKSYNKQNVREAIESGDAIFPLIAKPRSGFASRGLEIILRHDDLNRIEDFHVVQELAIPREDDPEYHYFVNQLAKRVNPQVSEVSIQLVADRNGNIIGRMISYNRLNNGIPIEIIPFENSEVWDEIEKLLPVFKKKGLKGPLNLQGRLTDRGLKLFEMNARFTGITGLRAAMGFNEVEACIKSWLGISPSASDLKFSHRKFGIRQTSDKAIGLGRNDKVKSLYNRLHPSLSGNAKSTLLLTGATGYLGRNLVDEVLKDKDRYNIIALVRDKEKASQFLDGESVLLINQEQLELGEVSLGNVDILVHAAFARPFCKEHEVASSLKFTSDILESAIKHQVPNIINISSQSVYGQEMVPPWNESTPIAPLTPYGMAKFASELILQSSVSRHPHINYTSLRVGALSGGANGLLGVDLLAKLTRRALSGNDLIIVGGDQTVERLDIRDAVSALMSIIKKPDVRWDPVYVVGSGMNMNIVDVAHEIANIVAEVTSASPVTVKVQTKDVKQHFGLDSSRFSKDFDWNPKYKISDIIRSLVSFYSKEKNEL